ncbi:hypothetical protein HDE_03968 [Halotydeus destructor]|nr:hypothetical protein HDE_03968 [Halotydeus destructor]
MDHWSVEEYHSLNCHLYSSSRVQPSFNSTIMAIYTKLTLAAILMAIAVASTKADTKCSPEDGDIVCIKSGLEGQNYIKVTIKPSINVRSMAFEWEIHSAACGTKPTGEPIEEKDDQVAAGSQGNRIGLRPTNGRACYYLKLSDCKSGGTEYRCDYALNAVPVK